MTSRETIPWSMNAHPSWMFFVCKKRQYQGEIALATNLRSLMSEQSLKFGYILYFGFFNFFCYIPIKISLAFIWVIIYYCTRDGLFRILTKTSFQLIYTRMYLIKSGPCQEIMRSWFRSNAPRLYVMWEINTLISFRILMHLFWIFNH
jgi:hypothetical protein